MRYLYYLLFISVIFISDAHSASLEASVDRNKLQEGQALVLTLVPVEADSDMSIDISPLEKDFSIEDRTERIYKVIINGRYRPSRSILLTLFPKRSGNLSIPPLTMSNAQTSIESNSLPITVTEAPEADKSAISLRLYSENQTVYIGQEVKVSLEFRYSTNVRLIRNEMPDFGDIEFDKRPQNDFFDDSTNQKVAKFDFFITPEQAGDYTIEPISWLLLAGDGNNRLLVNTEALTLTVKDKPTVAKQSDWLPAKNLELSDQINGELTLSVGESVEREVLVAAYGAHAEQIPELTIAPIQSVNVYNELPQRKNERTQYGTAGYYYLKTTYIPQAPGTYTLPSIQVHWWNTLDDKAEVSIIPEKTLTVLAGSAGKVEHPTSGLPNPSSDHLPVDGLAKNTFQWVVIGLVSLVIAAISLSSLLMLKRRWLARTKKVTLRSLRKQVESEQIAEFQSDLLAWASQHYHQSILSLEQLARIEPRAQQFVTPLLTSVYSEESTINTQTSALALIDVLGKTKTKKTKKAPILKQLYPS